MRDKKAEFVENPMTQRAPADDRGRKRRVTMVLAALAVAGVISGTLGLAVESQPWLGSNSFGGLPCLLNLGSGWFGLVFVNFDLQDGGVYYAVLNADGHRVLSPIAVTPLQRESVGPVEAMARVDNAGNVHIAYSLWDPDRANLSFYYVRVDAASGRVIHSLGPLGSLSMPWIVSDHPPGMAVDATGVQVAWPANASQVQALGPTSGPWMVARVSFAGTLLGSPTETAQIDNASFFLPRVLVPGGTEYVDYPASYIADGAATIFVWVHQRIWYTSGFSRLVYNQAFDLRFQRDEPGNVINVTLLSSEANWWMGRPWVAPSIGGIIAGATTLAVLGWWRLREVRRGRTRRPPTAP